MTIKEAISALDAQSKIISELNTSFQNDLSEDTQNMLLTQLVANSLISNKIVSSLVGRNRS